MAGNGRGRVTDKIRIHLRLTHEGDGRRAESVARRGIGAYPPRFADPGVFKRQTATAPVERRFLTGDASLRAYETIHTPTTGQHSFDGLAQSGPMAPRADGKPYPKVAHLAEEILPFCSHRWVSAGVRPSGAECAGCRLRQRASAAGGELARHGVLTQTESRLPSAIRLPLNVWPSARLPASAASFDCRGRPRS